MLQLHPGADVALLNVIVTEGLYDRQYIKAWAALHRAVSRRHGGSLADDEIRTFVAVPEFYIRMGQPSYHL